MSHLKCVWRTQNATASDSIAQWTMGTFSVDAKDAGEGKRDKTVSRYPARGGGGGTLGISGWGCAAGTLEPLTYTRASSAEFGYPILE